MKSLNRCKFFATAAIVTGFVVSSTSQAVACGWDYFEMVNPGQFYGISATSPSDMWITGNQKMGSTNVALTQHFNGHVWSTVSSVAVGVSSVLARSTPVSTNDVWAVGNSNNGTIDQPLIEHWNGVRWSVISSPSFSNKADLFDVRHVASNDIWAVGIMQTSASVDQTLVEHWDGSSWSVVPSPNVAGENDYLTGVATVGPADVWAVGVAFDSSGNLQALAEHWNGVQWSIVPTATGSAEAELSGAAAPSANDVWALGVYVNGSGVLASLAERWNGATWSIVPTPNVNTIGNDLAYATSVGPNDVWSTGAYQTSDNIYHKMVQHFNGSTWSIVPSPLTRSTINWGDQVKAFSPTDAWLVSSMTDTGGVNHAFREHYHC